MTTKSKQTLLLERVLEKGYFNINDMENIYHCINYDSNRQRIMRLLRKKYVKNINRGSRVLYIKGDKFPLPIPE